jgi:hypothetical protein
VFEKFSRRSEPVEHEADGCDVDQGRRRLDHIFVVFAESAIAAEPSKAALHNPVIRNARCLRLTICSF